MVGNHSTTDHLILLEKCTLNPFWNITPDVLSNRLDTDTSDCWDLARAIPVSIHIYNRDFHQCLRYLLEVRPVARILRKNFGVRVLFWLLCQ